MGTIIPGSSAERFKLGFETILSAQDFHAQVHDILTGKSASLRIQDPSSGSSVKKIRFFSREFGEELQKLKDSHENLKKIADTPAAAASQQLMKECEPLLQLFVTQIAKKNVIYKERVEGGGSHYFASKDILDKIRQGEFSIKNKQVAIAGETDAAAVHNGTRKEINIDEIDDAAFAEVAEKAKSFFDSLSEETTAQPSTHKEQTKPNTESTTVISQEAPAQPQQASLLKENTHLQQETQSPSLSQAPEDVEKKDMAKEIEAEREFREHEKEKDMKAKEKAQELEAKEILKESVQEVEISKKEASSADLVE